MMGESRMLPESWTRWKDGGLNASFKLNFSSFILRTGNTTRSGDVYLLNLPPYFLFHMLASLLMGPMRTEHKYTRQCLRN